MALNAKDVVTAVELLGKSMRHAQQMHEYLAQAMEVLRSVESVRKHHPFPTRSLSVVEEYDEYWEHYG